MQSDRSDSTKKTLRALEKVFAAEIVGHLPFQSKAKIFAELCDVGLLEPMQRRFGGRFPVTVSGYQLTHAGRITYCASCEGEDVRADGPKAHPG